jgi:hypothetical protein
MSVLSLRPWYWSHTKRTKQILPQRTVTLHSENVILLQKNAGWWVIVYYIQRILLTSQDYDASFQVYVSMAVCDPDIHADIPSIQRENFHNRYHTRNAYLHTQH